MTEAREYLFMHAHFQFEVLANFTQPNPTHPSGVRRNQVVVSLVPPPSAAPRAPDGTERTHNLHHLNQHPPIKLDVTAKS